MAEQAISFNDLINLPSPELKTASKEVTVQGKPFTVVIYADARENAERLYQLAGCHERARLDCGAVEGIPKPETIGLRFILPPTAGGRPETIHVKDVTFLTQLYILEAVALEPKWSAKEWATLARKMGNAQEFESLVAWVTKETGYAEYVMGKVAALKKAVSGIPDLPETSSELA